MDRVHHVVDHLPQLTHASSGGEALWLRMLAQAAPAGLEGTAIAVMIAYLILLLVLGYAGYRKSVVSEEDYYLAGRSQGWIVSSLTIMATFFSSFALLGAPGLVYKEGVIFALFALNVPLSGAAVYLLGGRISRMGRSRGYVTPADMLSDYYDSPVVLRLLVALIGFLYAVPYVVMQLSAGGIVSKVLFSQSESAFGIGVGALAAVTMVYVIVGGMRSVAWTDVIQGSLLILGMLLAGAATVAALGGVGPFFEKVSQLPPKSLSAPGTTGSWTVTKLFTVCLFASVGSMIQPAQWMRYYAARSTTTLKRSSVIFGTVLTCCFLFGVMLVGLGGQALYPIVDEGGVPLPHPDVGVKANEFDYILVVVLTRHLPELLGPMGVFVTALIVVAIMAASMSTADSNLHALSAVLTRDVYDRFLRPRAGERERTWVGRLLILAATVTALILIYVSRRSQSAEAFDPVALIAQLGFLAISFSSQLLPVTFDVLFLRKGTRVGAVCGIITGLGIVFLFTPFFSMVAGDSESGKQVLDWVATIRKMSDVGAFAFVFNVIVFAAVSVVTRRPDVERVREFEETMGGRAQPSSRDARTGSPSDRSTP